MYDYYYYYYQFVIDQTTACTIATSLIHSKIDYCRPNSSTQSTCYTLTLLNFITLLLFLNLQFLIIYERNKYKVLSHIYKFLKTGQPCVTTCSLLSFPSQSHRCIALLGCPLMSPLVALLSPLVLK